MSNQTSETVTGYSMISPDRRRPKPKKVPFTYNWHHQSTGNSGTGTIHMTDRPSLEEWIARWNHSNFANGWHYSLP